MSMMGPNWDNGFQAALQFCEENQAHKVATNFKEKLVYKGELSDRGDHFQRGFREGLITGESKYYEANKKRKKVK